MGKTLMMACGRMGRPYLNRTDERGMRVAVLNSAAALSPGETHTAMGPRDAGYPVPGDVKIEFDVLPGDELHALHFSTDRAKMVVRRAADRAGLDEVLTGVGAELRMAVSC